MPSPLTERIQVTGGDITKLAVDAIVNAANESLLGGGGVDGAIHRAAGRELLEECRGIGGCPTGEARITRGYRLPARFVIHTVGPRYGKDSAREAKLLASCYVSSLKLAVEKGLATIAFPCISTGVYGYPKAEACKIAVGAVMDWLKQNSLPQVVTFCCYDKIDAKLYEEQVQACCAI